MRILAVDTTTQRGSAALVDGDEVLGEVRFKNAAGHSTLLLPAIAFLVEGLGIPLQELDGLGVTVGPGSYTGLRVGISTVQGLALATGRPCVGVSALDALAHRMRGAAAVLVPMIDAYRDEIFAARYDEDARPLVAPVVQDPGEFVAELPEEPAFLGDGVLKHRALVQSLRPRARFPGRSLYLASSVARLSALALADGRSVPPAELRPLYLRGVDARRAVS